MKTGGQINGKFDLEGAPPPASIWILLYKTAME